LQNFGDLDFTALVSLLMYVSMGASLMPLPAVLLLPYSIGSCALRSLALSMDKNSMASWLVKRTSGRPTAPDPKPSHPARLIFHAVFRMKQCMEWILFSDFLYNQTEELNSSLFSFPPIFNLEPHLNSSNPIQQIEPNTFLVC
jgi:hypothetical protein